MVCNSKATSVMRAALLIDGTLESYRGRGLKHLSAAPGIPWYSRAGGRGAATRPRQRCRRLTAMPQGRSAPALRKASPLGGAPGGCDLPLSINTNV